MRLVVPEMCALFVSGVVVAMVLAIWGTGGVSATQASSGQRFATELVWAAIPCLLALAAVVLAVIAVVSSN
jgi:hypothetical protein